MKSKYEGKFKSGDRYSMLVIVDGKILMNNDACIRVKCDCGNEKIVSVINLLKGRCISCGCQMNKSGKNHPLWSGGKFISGTKYKKIKRNAETRSMDFRISMEYIENILENQNFKCAITGLKLDKSTYSLDVINPKNGYIEENVRWIHKDVNIMKNSYSDDYFRYLCSLVAGVNTKEIQRNRFRRIHRIFTLQSPDKKIYDFNSLDEMKEFIEKNNDEQRLFGPSRIGWNEISRFRESKGWKIIRKKKVI